MEYKKIGFPLALILAVIIALIPMDGLSFAGHMTIALLIFSIVMWTSESVPLAVTSLIILFIQPILGICNFEDAVIHFANPIVFLMIGGFIIAEGIRQSGLIYRVTYVLLKKFGRSSSSILLIIIVSTAILSAWIENVIAFVIMIPIITELIFIMGCKGAEEGKSNFAKALILGGSFASLAGGMATEIGTAPNLMAAAYTHIPFANWLFFGVPITVLMLLGVWKLLSIIFPFEVSGIKGGDGIIDEKLEKLGKISREEKFAGGILLFSILLWLTTSFTGIDSYSVALIGASLFFLFKLLDWKETEKNIDWGLILFFGGALSLGGAIISTGVAEWLVNSALAGLGSGTSPLIIMAVLIIVAVPLTQVMSNVAVAAILVPLSVTLAQSQDLAIGSFAAPIALICSLSFLFPMSDPTVAMAYGTKYVSMKDILKAGIPVLIMGIIIILAIMFTFGQQFTG